jgi:hypothetical protein
MKNNGCLWEIKMYKGNRLATTGAECEKNDRTTNPKSERM